MLLLAALIGSVFYFVPGRAVMPPLVESDYAYQLIAAKRFAAGEGLNSLQPVAPGQPWTLRYDFGFLTQWPLGYPMLIGTLSALTGATVIECARGVALVAISAALAGWFLLARCLLPVGVTRNLVALLAAATGAAAGMLINPSTDAIVIALLPLLAIGVLRSQERIGAASHEGSGPVRSTYARLALRFAALGIAGGLLCWFRYAAIFVSAGAWLMLSLRCAAIRRSFRDQRGEATFAFRAAVIAALAFMAGTGISLGGLLLINASAGPSADMQQSLNLGTSAEADFSPALLWTAWRTLTDFGFYAHRPAVAIAIRSAPLLILLLFALNGNLRAAAAEWLRSPRGCLTACLTLSLIGMVVLATALFGDKFDYVALGRYYLPVRPLCVVVLFGAGLLSTRILARGAIGLIAAFLLVWVVQIDAHQTWQRWRSDGRESAPSGAWNRCYEGSTDALYAWAKERSRRGDVLLSNFHEFVALETGALVLPVPETTEALEQWLTTAKRLAQANAPAQPPGSGNRAGNAPRVFFLLDPDNKWRSYWIDAPDRIVAQFGLVRSADLPDAIAPFVYEWEPGKAHANGRASSPPSDRSAALKP